VEEAFMETYQNSVDVLVVGGGTAGAVAAIQAARAGARTALVEMGGQLGGTMTTGGVSAPAYFYSRDRQVIAGIGWELVRATKALDGTPWPDFAAPNPRRPSYHVGLNPAVYVLVAEEACRAAGVALHYHEIVTDIHAEGERWAVESVGKGLRRTVLAREVIDATGDADLVGMLGLARRYGDVRQPGTLIFRFGGYDVATLDMEVVQDRYEAALAAGRLRPGDFWRGEDQPFINFLRARGTNAQHIFGADSSTAATQTEADIAGRQAALRLLRFIRSLPGCEDATLDWMCTQATARETYRIVGEATITYEDYVGGCVFDDAVCYTYYYVDVHTEHGVEHEFIAEGRVPTVPLGALIPRGSRRLLVAGRCVSSDRRANSGLRVEASCMAMGQAAGAAAALAAAQGVPSREVPIADVRALLREHGAIVPELGHERAPADAPGGGADVA
jgi:glycine/D-amino acid oxidase-like deaminating enzyme